MRRPPCARETPGGGCGGAPFPPPGPRGGLAFAVLGAWVALRHARSTGQLRPSEKPGVSFWAGLAAGAGALAILSPLGAERLSMISFLALPLAAWPQRFLTPFAGYIGWSALVPFALAL